MQSKSTHRRLTIRFTEPDSGLRVAVISDVLRAERPLARLLVELEQADAGMAFLYLPSYIHIGALASVDQALAGRGLLVRKSRRSDRKSVDAEAEATLVAHANKYFRHTLPNVSRFVDQAS
ncbi:hypothetical protein [Caballeronia sp. LZ001]|uniref:hypothetical protein n=1 Tax=Caballeronia sp. LZ001 TaxID=3038553 RepID=UPI0028625E56|nr:hypothetical protein [Caballeronia sp. LZ001]MDR5803752.1 hypothetical protein [Caballeronia sp. LZ001]